jgi:hypothetical protein
MEFYGRGAVEDPVFTLDLSYIRPTYPEIDDIIGKVAGELSEHPSIGTALEVAPDYRVYVTASTTKTPAFYILYKYDTKFVYLMSIHEVK